MDAIPCRVSAQDSVVDTRRGSECPLQARVSSHRVEEERLSPKPSITRDVHTCVDCGQGFSDIPRLLQHQERNHTLYKPYCCPTCGQVFALLSSLRLHCRTHAASAYPSGVSCPTSSSTVGLQQHRTLPERLLGYHRHLQDREPYACASCGRAFSHKPALLHHQQAGCSAPGNTSWAQMPTLSPLPTTLQDHVVTPVALPDAHYTPPVIQNSMLAASSPPSPVMCSVPVTTQAPPTTPQAPEHSTLSPPAASSSVASCPRSLTRTYFCSLCCRKFGSQVGLASHQRLGHPVEWKQAQANYWKQGGKKFPCPSCDKVFCHSPSLYQHKLRCLKRMARKSTGVNETVEVKPHTKEQVFPCRSCDMVFSQTSSLQLHRKEQHRRPVRARERGRASTAHPKRRSRRAGTYPCTFCGKVFGHHLTRQAHVRALHAQPHLHLEKRSQSLRKNREVSGQEGPGRKATDQVFRCPWCGRAYRYINNLIRHHCKHGKVLQKAVGQVPSGEGRVEEDEETGMFPCSSCEEIFSKQSFLREHELIHQSVEESKACSVCLREVGAPWTGETNGVGARIYHCEPCRRTFRTLQVFLQHCERHLGAQNVIDGVGC